MSRKYDEDRPAYAIQHLNSLTGQDAQDWAKAVEAAPGLVRAATWLKDPAACRRILDDWERLRTLVGQQVGGNAGMQRLKFRATAVAQVLRLQAREGKPSGGLTQAEAEKQVTTTLQGRRLRPRFFKPWTREFSRPRLWHLSVAVAAGWKPPSAAAVHPLAVALPDWFRGTGGAEISDVLHRRLLGVWSMICEPWLLPKPWGTRLLRARLEVTAAGPAHDFAFHYLYRDEPRCSEGMVFQLERQPFLLGRIARSQGLRLILGDPLSDVEESRFSGVVLGTADRAEPGGRFLALRVPPAEAPEPAWLDTAPEAFLSFAAEDRFAWLRPSGATSGPAASASPRAGRRGRGPVASPPAPAAG